MLLLAFLSLLYSAIGSLRHLGDANAMEPYNAVGKVVLYLPVFAGSILTIGSVLALWHWTNHKRSSQWALGG
jgi:hypothetical protein